MKRPSAGARFFLALFAVSIFSASCADKKGDEGMAVGEPHLEDYPVDIADHNFEILVLFKAGIPPGELMRSHLLGLEVLDAANQGITGLSGIESFPSLRVLNLSSNFIRDLSPLAGLATLESLDLSHNYIVDVSPLSQLTGLKQLDLSNNEISSISHLAGCVGLVDLDLSANLVSDITAISGLTNLRWLDLSNNNLTNIEGLYRNCQAGGLGPGDRVILTNNVLDNISMLNYLPHLRGAGVTVQY